MRRRAAARSREGERRVAQADGDRHWNWRRAATGMTGTPGGYSERGLGVFLLAKLRSLIGTQGFGNNFA